MDLSLDVQTREFEAYIDRITRGMEPEVLRKTLVTKAFDFVTGVVKLTPKDTGRAAGAWTPWTDWHAANSNDAPVEVKPFNPGDTVSATGPAEGKPSGSYREDLHGPSQYVEITNGMPYILALEYGHSQKATGAVRINMRRIREGIEPEAQKRMSELIRDAEKKTRGIRG